MSLIVEDGTGLAGAESYVSVTDADTYHDKRGNTAWATLTTAQKVVKKDVVKLMELLDKIIERNS